jgi:hypothetical protein
MFLIAIYRPTGLLVWQISTLHPEQEEIWQQLTRVYDKRINMDTLLHKFRLY